MVVYQVAQLGDGWAVFRIDGKWLAHVDGPYRSRTRALARRRVFERREILDGSWLAQTGVNAWDE